MPLRLAITTSLLCAALACEKTNEQPARKVLAADPPDSDYEVVGVSAKDFQCTSVAPLDEVSEALGVDVEPTDPHFEPPAGAPRPCNYVGPAPEALGWSFDLDCRESAPKTGDELMVVYATKPESIPVHVGKSGIDHRDSVLLFIDDDTPCWGRVMGPGADRRLALARLISNNLNIRNAPREVIRKTAKRAPE